jgi:signal transduction histidine kinase
MLEQNDKIQTANDLHDTLSANLKKAEGIAALINTSATTDSEIQPHEMEWATWALMDLLREAREVSNDIKLTEKNQKVVSL